MKFYMWVQKDILKIRYECKVFPGLFSDIIEITKLLFFFSILL